MQRCSVEGCEEYAVVAPLVLGWTGAAGTYAMPGLTYTNEVDRPYCGKHRPATEAGRLYAEAQRLMELDDLLALAMAVANGWPNESAPPHIREEYIDALKEVANDLLEQHAGRVAFLRTQNAEVLAAEAAPPVVWNSANPAQKHVTFSVFPDAAMTGTTAAMGDFRLQGSTTPPEVTTDTARPDAPGRE